MLKHLSSNRTATRHAVIQNEHLAVFRQHFNGQSEAWVGSNVSSWSNWVLERLVSQHSLETTSLPNRTVSRNELCAMSEDSAVDDLTLVLSILSWGGMHRRHAVSALATWSEWRHIITRLREGLFSRSAAYNSFANVRRNKLLTGMGPAYFTKLIYFCDPNHDGYIMDQWTARSSNLLGISPAIKMYAAKDSKFMGVSDKNTSETYEAFCRFIEYIGDSYFPDFDYSSVEEAMFSEGRDKGAWRSYVIAKT